VVEFKIRRCRSIYTSRAGKEPRTFKLWNSNGFFPWSPISIPVRYRVEDDHIWCQWPGNDTEAVKAIMVTRAWGSIATMFYIVVAYGCSEVMFLVRFSPACIHHCSTISSESWSLRAAVAWSKKQQLFSPKCIFHGIWRMVLDRSCAWILDASCSNLKWFQQPAGAVVQSIEDHQRMATTTRRN
jgi:hypothetical protein